MTKIKIGQFGIGHNHGTAKMDAVRKFPELFEVTGYAEENEEWVRRRGGAAAYRDLPRLTADEVIGKSDAILVETDVWDLTAAAQRCIDAGKHIHLDKPTGGTLAEYRRLLDGAKKMGLVVQLGYMYRYNPAVQRCFEMALRGDVGEITGVNAEMSLYQTPQYREWLTNFGGGAQFIFGCHLADLVVSLLGQPKKVTSFLMTSGQDGVEVPDVDLSVLEYERALARIYVSSLEIGGKDRRQFVVSGSAGTVCICPLEGPTTMWYAKRALVDGKYRLQKEMIPVEDHTKDGRYDDMMRAFHAYVTGREANPYSYEHEYAVQEVVDAMVGGIAYHGRKLEALKPKTGGNIDRK